MALEHLSHSELKNYIVAKQLNDSKQYHKKNKKLDFCTYIHLTSQITSRHSCSLGRTYFTLKAHSKLQQ